MLIHAHVRNAIADLMMALEVAQESCTQAEFESIRHGIGGCLGDLQMDVLEIVNTQHPQLDDLRNSTH